MDLLKPYTFYFEVPIYTPIKIDDSNDTGLWSLLNFSGSIDAYHPGLKENTTYLVNSCIYNNISHFDQYGGMNYSTLTCVRTKEVYYFYLYYDKLKKLFQKIGQFPSIADFHISQIKKYDKVLSKERLKEFTRAIGLAANGVGIGSFVYLRRIFEDLIEEAYRKAKKNNEWDDEKYLMQRMSDKIESLNAYLPMFLVENKTLYSILSTGIHSLKEEDCLAYFETVKVGIELILDEKVDEFNKQKKIEEAKQKLTALISKIPKTG
jgi:hypothetical protein